MLAAAWGLALLSMVLVPPDRAYGGYVDFRTLGLLFSLMTVMAGLQGLGLFHRMGGLLLARTATTRQLECVLIFLPFFFSMLVTNDVSLITFVPFALEVLSLAGLEQRAVPVVALQTIAANLGSMATPIGNPQNLYLYSHYQLSLPSFFQTTFPLALASFLLLALFLFREPSKALSALSRPCTGAGGPCPKSQLALYCTLFAVCLAAVARLIPVALAAGAVLLCVLAVDRRVLARVDYSLLLTFVGFFLFVGNLGRIPALHDLFQALLLHHEALCAAAASQIISNVPAALLLSGFTSDAPALVAGTNLGGLGTLIASMASLISYKYIARGWPQLRGRYLAWFTGSNLAFLIPLLALYLLVLA